MRTSNAISVTAVGLLAGLGLAACGGGGDGGDATAGAMSKPASVSVKRIQGTNALVDSRGRTLYLSDQEKGGKVLCKGGCTTIWDPASASGAVPALSGGKLEVVRRPDGSRQLALGRKPLYRFTQEGAGQLTGDGVVDSFGGTRFRWHAATAGRQSRSAPPSSKPSPGGYGY
jgi:predicted lipoprotein with Yx(FWY)xxD motif